MRSNWLPFKMNSDQPQTTIWVPNQISNRTRKNRSDFILWTTISFCRNSVEAMSADCKLGIADRLVHTYALWLSGHEVLGYTNYSYTLTVGNPGKGK